MPAATGTPPPAAPQADESAHLLRDAAATIYSKAQTLPYVAYSLNTARDLSHWIPSPVKDITTTAVNSAVRQGDRVLAIADTFIDNGTKNLRRVKSDGSLKKVFVDSTWFKTVDSAFITVDATLGLKDFMNSAQEQYMTLDQDGDGHVSRNDFISGLRTKIAVVWDERLVTPALAYYEGAKKAVESRSGMSSVDFQKKLEELRTQVRTQYENVLVTTFNEKLGQPAKTVYNTSVQYFIQLQQQPSVVSVEKFLQGMKVRIGSAYTEKLQIPLREFYAKAKDAGVSQYSKLSDYTISSSQVTLNDLLDAGKGVVGKTSELVGSVKTTALTTVENSKTAVFDRVNAGKSAVITRVNAGKDAVNERVNAGRNYVNDTLQYAIDNTASTLDMYVPDDEPQRKSKEGKGKKPKSLTDLTTLVTTRVSKTLKKKSTAGLNNLRKFSSDRLKTIIHVDLIAYAENVVDSAGKNTHNYYDAVQEKLTIAKGTVRDYVTPQYELVQSKVTSAKEFASAKKNIVVGTVTEKTAFVTGQVNLYKEAALARTTDLQVQIRVALEKTQSQALERTNFLKGQFNLALERAQSEANQLYTRVTVSISEGKDKSFKRVDPNGAYRDAFRSRLADAYIALNDLRTKSTNYVFTRQLVSMPSDAIGLLKQSLSLQDADEEYEGTVKNLKDVVVSLKNVLFFFNAVKTVEEAKTTETKKTETKTETKKVNKKGAANKKKKGKKGKK